MRTLVESVVSGCDVLLQPAMTSNEASEQIAISLLGMAVSSGLIWWLTIQIGDFTYRSAHRVRGNLNQVRGGIVQLLDEIDPTGNRYRTE